LRGAEDTASAPTVPASTTTAADGLDRVVKIDGDRGLYVRCTGTGSQTVVMEGGDGDTSDSYAFAEPSLAKVTRTCVYDRANLGRSDTAPGPRGLRELVGDLEKLLEAAKIPGPYVLVGTSGGEYITSGYAIAHPQEVAGMVFIDTGSPFENPPREIVEETDPANPANAERRDYLQVEKDAWAARKRVGDIPVSVVSVKFSPAAIKESPFPSERRMMRRNVEDQKGWLVLSPRAKQIVAHTSHAVEEDDPELVIDVIRDVVTASQHRSPSNEDTITGLKGHVVFTRAGGAYDGTIFVANADGTGQRRITGPDRCCPWATPSGSMVVFSEGAGERITAVTTNLDGSRRRVLPLPKGTLSLAAGPITKNGAVIAREGFDDVHPASAGIYLTRSTDGKVIRRVTKKPFIPGDFSPDGKQLVLFSGPDGEHPSPGSLWIVNTNGTALRRLTPARVKVQCCFNYRWSPDGTKIVFADFGGVIWTIAPDGSKLTEVFKATDGHYAVTPTWSPDGSMIMFALDPSRNPFASPPNALYVIRADGSDLTQVLGGNNFKNQPYWVSK
jgi:pimeloyl-ACP methyl ester carboxylesterase